MENYMLNDKVYSNLESAKQDLLKFRRHLISQLQSSANNVHAENGIDETKLQHIVDITALLLKTKIQKITCSFVESN